MKSRPWIHLVVVVIAVAVVVSFFNSDRLAPEASTASGKPLRSPAAQGITPLLSVALPPQGVELLPTKGNTSLCRLDRYHPKPQPYAACDADAEAVSLAQRFAGLELDAPIKHLDSVAKGIKGITG